MAAWLPAGTLSPLWKSHDTGMPCGSGFNKHLCVCCVYVNGPIFPCCKVCVLMFTIRCLQSVYFSWMQVLVCAVWLTLTSLDCSLYVLVAQHPCKCHGPLWLPEGYTYTCMEEMQSDTKLNCWGRFLLPDSCNCQRKAGLVDRLSIIITYVGIFLISTVKKRAEWDLLSAGQGCTILTIK